MQTFIWNTAEHFGIEKGVSMSTSIRYLCAITVVLFACSSAHATLFTVAVTAADGTQSQQVIASNTGTITTLPDGSQEWQGSVNQTGSYAMQWDLLLNADPSISGSIALTNSAASTQTFSVSVSLPTAQTIAAGAAEFGSSGISVSDANGDSLSTMGAPTGSAIYTAFINSNVTQKTLFPSPYALVMNGVPGGVATDTQSFATGVVSASAAVTTIGITHNFTLTGGDSATVNSTFSVVPEPCGALSAAIGALGLAAVFFKCGTK
jgi:hypothetical protein